MKKQYLFIVRKYVIASNVKDAIKHEGNYPVHDLWLEESSAKDHIATTMEAVKRKGGMGFTPK